MLDFRDLERFSRYMKKGFRPAVSEKINKSEVELLMLVSRKPDLPFRHYAHMIHLEKSSFSYIVDLLVLKGLVIKVEDEHDRRRKSLQITEKGDSIVKKLGKQRDDFIEERLNVLTEQEKEDLKKALETVKMLSAKIRESFPEEHRRPRKGHFHDDRKPLRGGRRPMEHPHHRPPHHKPPKVEEE